jgi:hypothetical protein
VLQVVGLSPHLTLDHPGGKQAMPHLAVFTCVLMAEAPPSARVAGFLERMPPAFADATKAPGFVWRRQGRPGAGTSGWFALHGPEDGLPLRYNAVPDRIARTLSVWDSIENAKRYVYSGLHAEALRHKRDWLLDPGVSTYALWWRASDDMPEWAEAVERFDLLLDSGPTASVFTFGHAFTPDGVSLRGRQAS